MKYTEMRLLTITKEDLINSKNLESVRGSKINWLNLPVEFLMLYDADYYFNSIFAPIADSIFVGDVQVK